MLTARRYIVALILVLLLAACGDDDVKPGATPTRKENGTVTPPESPTTPPESPTTPVPGVPWGPDDPPIPDQYAALAVSSSDELDCDAVDQNAPSNDFWSTVVEVCRALKSDGEWPTSGEFDPPPAANEFQDCLNDELATMLRALFAWRDAHPGAEPKIEYPRTSARSPCESRIYDAEVFEVPPDTSHTTGGVVVELYVPGLIDGDPSPEVRVDGEPVVLEDDFDGGDDGLSFGQIYIPAPIEAHRATIVVDAYFGPVSTTVELPDVQVTNDEGSSTTPTP
jgi:hypothetical protein